MILSDKIIIEINYQVPKEEKDMAFFCKNCGRPLQEGEVCHCTEGKQLNQQQYGQQMGQNIPNSGMNPQYYQPQNTPKKGIPRLLVPIGQTVIGGLLIAVGLITGGWDWSYIAYLTGAGFLLTGICGIIDAKK